jgi:hypothetical protein
MATSAVERAWNDQSSWSQAADRLKRELERWRHLALALAVLGAVLSASAVAAGLSSSGGKVLAFGSAASVAVAGTVRARTGGRVVQDWTRARSVSEAIKSEVYAHLVRGDNDDALDQRVAALEKDGGDLLRYKAAAAPRPRALPEVHDLESYLRTRVRGQIDGYYRPRARDLERKAAFVRRIELALGVAGALLAAAAGIWEEDAVVVWVPVVTTVAAAITAHAAAARFDYLVVEYLRTADELERLSRRGGTAAGLSDEELVAAAERIISIQNEGWMAKATSGDDTA